MTKRITIAILVMAAILGACDSAADVTSANLSRAAEEFEVDRRIVFINGITDEYLMTIEGRCSIEADLADAHLEVTCKEGEGIYKKHYLGLSDNITYLVEQMNPIEASEYRHRIVFRPSQILPDPEVARP